MAAGDRSRPRTGSKAPYIFPRHPREVDRLDLQLYALCEALGVVGCGTGQWAVDLSEELPAHGGCDVDPDAKLPHSGRGVGGRVGTFMASDFRAAFRGLSGPARVANTPGPAPV
jgi:hypothetical protein